MELGTSESEHLLLLFLLFFGSMGVPNTSKDHERKVRYIKGGLLRKGGYLTNVDGGPKKQHFPAFSQKFYFALVRINSQKFAHLKNERKNVMFGRCKFHAKQRPFHAKQCTFHAKQCTFHGLSMVCPWSNFLKI